MVRGSLEYMVKEAEKSSEKPQYYLIGNVPVLDKPFSSGKKNPWEKENEFVDDSYRIRETHYEQRIREGFTFKFVTPQELPPGIAGWYNPSTKEAVGVDREAREHEGVHHDLYAKNEVTSHHEQDVRTIMRNLLNSYGAKGDYHV